MGRKSKQAGTGHLPLTNHEIKTYSKEDAYGTTKARLSQDSQRTFADCCLSLHPATDRPVVTPSGFIYERSALLEYLLTKTQELKKERQLYELWLTQKEGEELDEQEKEQQARLEAFETSQRAVVTTKKRSVADINPLKRTSYWLAESQPEIVAASGAGSSSTTTNVTSNNRRMPPPKRPPSPNSGNPLHRKDLVELDLKRNSDGQVQCAISEKSITTQQALALVTKADLPAQVVLEQVYDDLGKDKVCPVTGRKIIKIVKLQRGGSSFASNGGIIEAKKYRPTMT